MATDWKDLLGALNMPGDVTDTPVNEDSSPREEGSGTDKTKKAVTLFYESKGRAGKPATILADFKGVAESEIEALASLLKKKLGTGGSCRGGEILIQGDRRAQLRALLSDLGYLTKG